MDRRAFGVLAVGILAGSTGCVSVFDTESGGRTTPQTLPELVTSIDFSITAEGENQPESPTITYLPEETQVRITGTMLAGNPCHEASLESLSFDEQTSELGILIEVEKVRSNCPDSLGTDTYELLVSFRSTVPDSITATHRDSDGETATTTKKNPG
jgi:hypothetical protein